jgi:hypothetical protein
MHRTTGVAMRAPRRSSAVASVAKVALNVAKAALNVAKVALSVAKVALNVAKVALNVAKVALNVAKVAASVAKVALNVAKAGTAAVLRRGRRLTKVSGGVGRLVRPRRRVAAAAAASQWLGRACSCPSALTTPLLRSVALSFYFFFKGKSLCSYFL